MEPVNYSGLLAPVQPVTAPLDQLQQEQAVSAQRALLANQYQQQLRTQHLQQAALQDAINNPSPQAYRNMLLVNPQAHEAISAAYKGLDEETQRSQLQDLIAVQGYLGAGQPDKAKAILQQHIAAAKKAGQNTTAYDSISDLIDSKPDYARALVGMTLAGTAGADKMAQTQASFGKEARDAAGFPVEQDLKQAQAAQARAQAAKDSYATVGVDQSLVPLPGAAGAAPTPVGDQGAPPSPGAAPTPVGAGLDKLTGMGATITSAYRTPQHNAEVGGVPNSQHLTGQAVDLVPPNGMSMVQLAVQAQKAIPGAKIINEGDHIHVQWGSPQGASAQGQVPGQVQPIFQGPMANPQDAQLSPEAVDMAAFNFLRYGPSALQNLGQGKTGVLNKNRIMDRVANMAKEAGTSNPDLVASWAQNKANGEALTQNTKNLTQISASENTLNANLDFAMGLAKRGLGPTGVPYLDMPINKIRMGLGSADAKTLDNVLTTSGDEYARILSGSPSGSGNGTSDSSRAEAHKLINSGMTLRQLTDAINAAKVEAANRRQAYVNESARLTGEISGRLQPGSASSPGASQPSPMNTAPAQRQQQAPVRVRSIQEAQALPPGAPFLTPDGRLLYNTRR